MIVLTGFACWFYISCR